MSLYKAVERYVIAKGGTVACIGGIQIIQFPQDRALNYTVLPADLYLMLHHQHRIDEAVAALAGTEPQEKSDG